MQSSMFRSATIALAMLVLLAWNATADASRFGRDGFSGNPQTNGGASCSACHAPGATVPSVTISGPQVLDAETIAEYTVTISGGPAVTGGLGVSASDAAGSFSAVDGDVHVVGDEISHVQPKSFSAAGSVSFRFRWRAPAYNGPVTLYAAGNSSNGQLNLLGDAVDTAQFTVTVNNGDPEPPPPPPPPPANASLEPFVTGLARPVVIANAGDSRLFVVEQSGRIRVVDGGAMRATPFLDITGRVDDAGNEQGLLGLAFHPDYADNGYLYVNYTYDPPGSGADRIRISRFTVGADPNVADPGSELVLMEFTHPFDYHNGGDIQFGPDGYLYISSGDGGSGGDPQNNAQNPNVPLGKLLRIDVDGGGTAPDCNLVAADHYGIPPDNAFTDGNGGAGCDEVFALGLRNPWRIAFDSLTGDLWIADVGQSAREEINLVPAGTAAGLNFGWRCYEGNEVYNGAGCDDAYFAPLVTTTHAGGNCSITGGRVYRGGGEPALTGRYFFSDFCNTTIRAITFDDGEPVVEDAIPASAISQPVAFGEDIFGELYVASLTGTIYRIRGAGDTPVSQIATLSGQCLHASGTGTTSGTKLVTWPCSGGTRQRWILRGDGSILNPASGRCVDVPGGNTTPGAVSLQLSDCNGQATQRFTPTSANELRGVGGLCMERSRSARRRVQMGTCQGGGHQVWFFAPVQEALRVAPILPAPKRSSLSGKR